MHNHYNGSGMSIGKMLFIGGVGFLIGAMVYGGCDRQMAYLRLRKLDGAAKDAAKVVCTKTKEAVKDIGEKVRGAYENVRK